MAMQYQLLLFIAFLAGACGLLHSAAQAQYRHYENHHQQKHHRQDEGRLHRQIDHEKAESYYQKKRQRLNETHSSKVSRKAQKQSHHRYGSPEAVLPHLKAVLVAANVDGPDGRFTQIAVKAIRKVEDYLKEQGVQVEAFYCPHDDWEAIAQACKGAQILVYHGHGVYDGTKPQPEWVGGFSLSEGVVSSHKVSETLQMHENALVLFHQACFTAGSSASDGDRDIGMEEAKRRVAMYAHPFTDMGFGGYYANNYFGAPVKFLERFLAGQTLGAIFNEDELYYGSFGKAETRFPYKEGYEMGVCESSHGDYSVAMVGDKDFSVLDLQLKD